MTTGDFFWLFLMIVALQPIFRKKMLEMTRQRSLARFERQRGSRLILLIHREETMSLLGFPVFRYIDVNDSEEVLRAINMTDPDVPLDIVLHTPGGLVLASVQIARAIHKYPAKVTVFVPHYAMSGGTLIALAADEIVMSEHATLGPVDPQLGQFPAASIMKVMEQKPIAEVDDQTVIMADLAKKALDQVHRFVRELLSDKMEPDKAEQLTQLIAEGAWTHDRPITFEDAKEMGLPVKSDIPKEVLDLLALYPQPVRRQSTVEYIPMPRHADRP